MRVDYTECKICGDSIIDDVCYDRIINNKEVIICDYCVEKEIKKGIFKEIDINSKEYETLSDEEKGYIEDYGCIYKYTSNGVSKRLIEIDDEIKRLLKEKEELLSMN